ncbi:TetR family transcriptional regulator [Nocardioides sp. 1609]|uniref:TetR/AcrR family transcriptional regulator n=1 Tax=Nocardioides sp. 1609 TaxID=2508327 RepID=UPI0010702524|nr:TetR family transcriptional regulator [Nocardioides sp. 1609]
MTRSATRDRAATSWRITRSALLLTDRHGLDGFTMDDLADAAEVSRRTLFNYFPGKLDAILGDWPVFDADALATFRAGGPHHDLVLDLRTLVTPLFDEKISDRELLSCSRRVLLSAPRLHSLAHERYEALSAEIVEHVVVREGAAFGAAGAKVAIKLLVALFDAALDGFIHDADEQPFSHHFDQSLRTARSLLGASS